MLREVKLYWTWLHEPRETEEGKYRFVAELTNLTKEQAADLHSIGMSVKKGKDQSTPQPEKNNYVSVWTGKQPKVCDAEGNYYQPDDVPKVGNGTLANVLIAPWEWSRPGKNGTSAFIQSVQILDLVPLDNDEEEDESLRFGKEEKYIKKSKSIETVAEGSDPEW